MRQKIAVFPGSFDPITLGHFILVQRASPMFDKIIVAMGSNTTKKYLFDESKRLEFLNSAFENMPKVEVQTYSGLTIDFCNSQGANFILRGLRNSIDFEYERSIAQMNKAMSTQIETVMLVTDPDLSHISSSIVREIIKTNGDVAQFLPPNVKI